MYIYILYIYRYKYIHIYTYIYIHIYIYRHYWYDLKIYNTYHSHKASMFNLIQTSFQDTMSIQWWTEGPIWSYRDIHIPYEMGSPSELLSVSQPFSRYTYWDFQNISSSHLTNSYFSEVKNRFRSRCHARPLGRILILNLASHRNLHQNPWRIHTYGIYANINANKTGLYSWSMLPWS